MTLLQMFHSPCSTALPIQPINHQPKYYWADSGTANIKVNPTQVCQEMGHPVHALEIFNKESMTLSQVQGNHHPSPGELKLQHAVLGALRNLAVNPVARRQLVAMGLLDPCLQLSQGSLE